MKDTTKMTVDSGVCKFVTRIEAHSDDGMTISLAIDSECPNVRKLADSMQEVELFDAIATPITENPVFAKCGEFLIHAACPVPVALVKVCEVVGQLALKKDVSMRFE